MWKEMIIKFRAWGRLPQCRGEEKRTRWVLRMAAYEDCCMPSVPFIFQFWVYLQWFHPPAKVLELRKDAKWCQTTGAEARAVGKALVYLQCQLLGLDGIKGEIH